jgi:exodeoxyribonuclease-5
MDFDDDLEYDEGYDLDYDEYDERFDPMGPFDDVVTGGVGRPPHDTSHLSDHQIEALKTIADWFNSGKGQIFRLFGCAGVGKTTLAKSVAPELRLTDDRYMFAAYTGKAVHVLRGKGCLPASTLHSLLYLPAGNQAEKDLERAKARLEKLQPGTPEHKECRSTIKELEIAAKQLGWKLNPESPLAELDLLICDEVSMVDAEMATDILSFSVRVLVLGDTEQLPPVGGTAGYFTAVKPDFELTEVHRQAAESPVLRLATRIRTSTDRSFGLTAADYVAPPRMADALGYDQVLCGTNRSRWTFIEGARRALGYPVGMPVAGDKVICLKNNRDLGIFNGQQFVVLACAEEADGVLALSLRGDDDREYAVLSFHGGFLGLAGEKALGFKGFSGRIGAFTFAWAITVHRSQGSEWSRVLVWDESRAFTRDSLDGGRRWLYTGVTRASTEVALFRR